MAPALSKSQLPNKSQQAGVSIFSKPGTSNPPNPRMQGSIPGMIPQLQPPNAKVLKPEQRQGE